MALAGVKQIIHAGDVGDLAILDALRTIAPMSAVRGNVDRDAWAQTLPLTQVVDIAGKLIYGLHDLGALGLDPAGADFAAVIYGHWHIPEIRHSNGVLYLKPGNAGPRRFSLPVSLARLIVDTDKLTAEPVTLDV